MPEVSLDEVMARAPSGLPLPVGCWVVARVAEALASAPRSVTPREVRIGEQGEIRLAPPRPGTAFAYLAPEVVQGDEPDARSAVFGLGSLLVELVTGKSPFARESDMKTRLAVMVEPTPGLIGRVAEASAELEAIVRRALEKSPADRFASTSELAARLDAFLSDELHDVDAARVAGTVRSLLGGGPTEARSTGFTPTAFGGPVGEPDVRLPAEMPVKLAPPEPARRPTPPPGAVAPARKAEEPKPTPTEPARRVAPGVIEPTRKPTPPPGVIEPAKRPTPPPGVIEPAKKPAALPGVIEPTRKPTPPPGAVQPVRRPTPGPGIIEPAKKLTPAPGAIEPPRRPTPPPGPQAADLPLPELSSLDAAPPPKPRVEPRPRSAAAAIESAELDLTPDNGRSSSPTKPKLDTDVDRIGDPLLLEQQELGAPLGQGAPPARPQRPALLPVDEEAVRKERSRPATMAPEPEVEPEDPGTGWIKPLVYVGLTLMALAIVYQFVVRPFLLK